MQICNTRFTRAKGLMFSKPRTVVLVFDKEEIHALHMMFVFFPIDVLFLNKDKVVVEIKERFMPFSYYTPRNKSKFVVEVPEPTTSKIGDKIEF